MNLNPKHVGYWRFRQSPRSQPIIYVDPKPLQVPVVYAFLVGGRYAYIGETDMMLRRMSQYATSHMKPNGRIRCEIQQVLLAKHDVEVCILYEQHPASNLSKKSQQKDRRLIESALIQHWQPLWNKERTGEIKQQLQVMWRDWTGEVLPKKPEDEPA
jgi:hypothetical protein